MYALIHDSQLILGPIGYNYRLINSELEELEIEYQVSPRDYENVPLQINDITFLLPITQIIPEHDIRFQTVGNFEWEIIKENEIPVMVQFSYTINDKTLDEVKSEYKRLVSPIRKKKENCIIEVEINKNKILVSTSREERGSYVSKMMSSPGPYNFKFKNDVWLEVNSEDLKYIISQIDLVVQSAFDWEYQKINEIDACTTIEEVFNIILEEPKVLEYPNDLRTNN